MELKQGKEKKPKNESLFSMEISEEVKNLIENMEEDSDDSEI